MTLVLGIDGGGTKTECVAAWLDGRVAGRGFGGPVNTNFVTAETARASLLSSIDNALSAARAAAGDVVRVAMGGPMRESLVASVIGERFPGVPLDLPGEGALVLAAGGVEAAGIALIAGTGSLALGVREGREPVTVGGWGTLMGDEGSAYDLGLHALQAVAHAADGRGPETLLTPIVLAWAGVQMPRELPSVVYGPDRPPDRTRLAALGQKVADAAEKGDPAAGRIVRQAADALYLHVATLVRRLDFDLDRPLLVVASGGVLRGEGPVFRELCDRLSAAFPTATLFVPRATAAYGGAALALRAEGSWGEAEKARLLGLEEETFG